MYKNKSFLLFIIMILSLFNNCSSFSAKERIKLDKITSKHVEPYKYTRTFILRFSNLVYYEEGREIIIPLFQGNLGDVEYKVFRDYCLKNKLLEPKVMESGFIIKPKKGEIRKTLHEFLAFYKLTIFRNINIEKPTLMRLSSSYWTINYDFKVNGVNCYISIELPPREEDLDKSEIELDYKSVYDIIPDEGEIEPGFTYHIYIGSKSTD